MNRQETIDRIPQELRDFRKGRRNAFFLSGLLLGLLLHTIMVEEYWLSIVFSVLLIIVAGLFAVWRTVLKRLVEKLKLTWEED